MKCPMIDPITNLPCFVFDSVSHFGRTVKQWNDNQIFGDQVITDKRHYGTQSNRPIDYDWDAGHDLATSIDTACKGGYWKLGADKLQEAIIKAPINMHNMLGDDLELSTMGAIVDVGEYLNNSPEAMLCPTIQEQKKPVVKLSFHIAGSFNCSLDHLINRGRAIMAVVEALENQGRKVEVTGISAFEYNGIGHQLTIKLKRADAPWCAANLAYVFAHPAFMRRAGFRFVEALDGETLCNANYGSGRAADIPYANHSDIHFGYTTGDQSAIYISPESALREAEKRVNAFHEGKK